LRGRRHDDGGWILNLCAGHARDRDGAGEAWPRLPVLVGVARAGIVDPEWVVRLNGLQMRCRSWSPETVAWLGRYLDGGDAAACALDPEGTSAALDAGPFAAGRRQFGVADAGPAVLAAAAALGMSAPEAERLVARARAEREDGGERPAWRAAARALLGKAPA
jgi:hypothetical protein